MSEGHIARHRNYSLLMKRHHRDLRIRRLSIVLIYVLLIIAIMALFIVMKKDEQRRKTQPAAPIETTMIDEGFRSEYEVPGGYMGGNDGHRGGKSLPQISPACIILQSYSSFL